MDSLSLSSLPDESHRTFLRAPDRAEISRVDPEGIAGAKKCLDFEEDCIRVYARIKPRSEEEEEEKEEEPRFRWVEREIVTEPCLSVGNGLSQRFLFSRIFESSVDQGTFFREMVRPRIVDFLTGSHQLLFAYGASSSGKTYTVQGTASQPGILPRSLDLIFNSLQADKFLDKSPLKPQGFEAVPLSSSEGLREDKESVLDLGSFLNAQDVGPEESLSASSRLRETSSIPGVDSEGMYYSLWVSFAEIYNETIHDLFERITVSNKKTRGSRKTPLKLVEDRKGCAYVKGLREICVSSADEAYQLLLIGRRNLQFAATKLNQNSSRSHCIFTVKLIRFCDLERPQLGRVHILSFCDLAGSERLKKTQTIGTRRAEAGNINASLLVLGRVMKILRDNQRLKKAAVVPFRDSKLTRLLQAFFTGMGKASMIVNISQSPYLFDETLQALKFAAITSKINYAAPSKPPRRNTRFSSILFQHKRSSTLGGRNTIVWENPPARSTLVPEKVQEEEGAREEEEDESSEEEEEDDSHYEALNNLISDLERRLREEKRKNATLESDIRMELCKEFNVMMVNRETEWQQRLKDTTERMDELSEWRLQKLESAYVVSRKRKRLDNSDEDELREKLSEVESKLEGRDIELEEKGKTLKALKETHKSLLDSRNKLQEELTAQRFTTEDQKGKILSLEEEMKKVNLESKSKDSAIESLSSNPLIKDLKNQLWDLKSKLTEKTEEGSYLKKLLDEASEEFLAKDDNESNLNSEILSLKAELASAQMVLSDAQDENTCLIKDSAQKQDELESSEELLNQLRTENGRLMEENLSLKKESKTIEDVEGKESEVPELQERIKELLHENDAVVKRAEDSEKAYQKMMNERQRLEKDLNDEIEGLRSSKLKIKSTDDGKSKKLLEKDTEIRNLEREIKSLLGDSRTHLEALDAKNKTIRDLESNAQGLKEEVLGFKKRTTEQDSRIQSLEATVKSHVQEEDVISILKKELDLKNSEKSSLLDRISELEDSAGRQSELSKTKDTVTYLTSQIEAKNYEIHKTKEEKESVELRYNKLIKCKDEEVSREKMEAHRLRDVMRTATPSKKTNSSNNRRSEVELEEEISKKDEVIKELEKRLQKSLCDGEVEDLLRDEIDSLKRSIMESRESHRKELGKMKKANEKIINEYKEANKELQKQVGISGSEEAAPPTDEKQMQQQEAEDDSMDSISMEQQSVKKRGGTARRHRVGSSTANADSTSHNLENEESVTRKSTRVTRSRPVHKTKKKNSAPLRALDQRKSILSDPESNAETPRKSKRNQTGMSDALSPLENLNGTWESSSRSPVKRQLRTRRKKCP